ncbi:MAG: hypothetical protein GYB66_04605 [Chloroflexi bacterium]|nr:hypothetical protein [Chloroflexota bacterium]
MDTNPSSSHLHRRRIKPTLDTQFQIDYSWWDRQEAELRTYISSFLSDDQQQVLSNMGEEEALDVIDSETAEVRQIDPLQHALKEGVEQIDFAHMPLVDAVFRVFLMNGNQPLSPNELSHVIQRPATTILRTLSGARVYRGIRPVIEDG